MKLVYLSESLLEIGKSERCRMMALSVLCPRHWPLAAVSSCLAGFCTCPRLIHWTLWAWPLPWTGFFLFAVLREWLFHFWRLRTSTCKILLLSWSYLHVCWPLQYNKCTQKVLRIKKSNRLELLTCCSALLAVPCSTTLSCRTYGTSIDWVGCTRFHGSPETLFIVYVDIFLSFCLFLSLSLSHFILFSLFSFSQCFTAIPMRFVLPMNF